MASVVVTLIGDDRAGLVDAVAGVVARHGGNWDRSHLAELAGKFAGTVALTDRVLSRRGCRDEPPSCCFAIV